MNGFVYFIAPEAALLRREEELQKVKIGHTRFNPVSRMSDLQCGSPVCLELLAYTDGPVQLKRAFHATFAEMRYQGEWFYLHGKLRDFLGYFDGLPPKERYVTRERLIVSLYDNVFAECAPHPSITDAEYLATADPRHLEQWFPEVFE